MKVQGITRRLKGPKENNIHDLTPKHRKTSFCDCFKAYQYFFLTPILLSFPSLLLVHQRLSVGTIRDYHQFPIVQGWVGDGCNHGERTY